MSRPSPRVRGSSMPSPSSQTRPKTTNPSLKGLRSLPHRLCNPPRAVGKVRSCGVTPIFKVRLQDVLDRKHLPPLGLKDFEEWLLYVELCPENLYFILWLAEYTSKYNQWVTSQPQYSNNNTTSDSAPKYRVSLPIQSSAQLALFYAKAKQTFFTPNSPYELNLPSDVLAPFHSPHSSPHPDPAIFDGVAEDVRAMLQASLDRLVLAAYNNVGNKRVMCGMIAGTLFALIGSVPPLAVNFSLHHERLLRLLALPGLWIGLTILIASLNGICIGVYVFGDLRQLKKFELSRPPISKPKLATEADRSASLLPALTRPPLVQNPIPAAALTTTPPSDLTRLVIPDPVSTVTANNSNSPSLASPTSTFAYGPAPGLATPPTAHLVPVPRPSDPSITQSRAASIYSCSSGSSSGSSVVSGSDSGDSSTSSSLDDEVVAAAAAAAVIHISPAYYDADPVEGPATAPVALDPHYQLPKPGYTFGAASPGASGTNNEDGDGASCSDDGEAVFDVGTAGFIHPFDVPDDSSSEMTVYTYSAEQAPEAFQRITPFDFEALPALIAPAYAYRFKHRQAQLHAHALPYPQAYQPQVYHPKHHANQYSNHPTQTHYRYEFPTEGNSKCGARVLVIERGSPAHMDERTEGWTARLRPRALIARMQTRCSARTWRIAMAGSDMEKGVVGSWDRRGAGENDVSVGEVTDTEKMSRRGAEPTSPSGGPASIPSALHPDPRHPGSPQHPPHVASEQKCPTAQTRIARVRSQFRRARAVPAFAVPLTRILSPVVVRGQWEIVVRSAVAAFVVSWVVVGALVAVPV